MRNSDFHHSAFRNPHSAIRIPHLAIRASAGSGKTFQLTNRLIGLLDAGIEPQHILATTFTRKAAGEILDRVLRLLANAALDGETCRDLARHLGDDSLTQERCEACLSVLVRNFHRLRICTLDSFFAQIASSFELDLGLPSQWRILEVDVDEQLRTQAMQKILSDDPYALVTLLRLLYKGDAPKSVGPRLRSLVEEMYALFLETSPEAWYRIVRPVSLPEEELERAIERLRKIPLPTTKAGEPSKSWIGARDSNFQAAKARDWQKFVSAGIAKAILDDKKTFQRHDIDPQVRRTYEPLIEQARTDLITKLADRTEAIHDFLRRFREEYEHLKHQRRGLRFEDVTAALVRESLTDRHEEVFYRLDARIDHLLLDEFQDTSLVQWQVLKHLAKRVSEDSLGHKSFFCVGDVKQAIYGWRGGVSEIFEALEEELTSDLHWQPLTKSFRSSPIVIQTVNQVFGTIGSSDVVNRYSSAGEIWARRFEKHTTILKNLPGHSRLLTSPMANEKPEQEEKTLIFAAERIKRLTRESEGHDIGVLVRDNKAVARLIGELRQRDVPASEEGGNPLTDSPAVAVILSALKMADHPEDGIVRFHVANSPLGPVLGLDPHSSTEVIRRISLEIRTRLLSDGYGPVLYHWARHLAESCVPRDSNRLLQLVELAYDYEKEVTLRPTDFVARVEARRMQDPSTSPVRVMTIHQAKGLEFDIVVLPQLDKDFSGRTPPVVSYREQASGPVTGICRYVNKDLWGLLPEDLRKMFEQHTNRVVLESLCVLYVAITRAVHALHMIIAPSASNERSIPNTYAGILRSALTDGGLLEPDRVIWEKGDPHWSGRQDKKIPKAPTETSGPEAAREPIPVRLAKSPIRRLRGLASRSPSGLEGGSKVDLAHRMRMDTTDAMEKGTLFHGWLEQLEWLDDGELDDEILREVAGRLRVDEKELPSLIEEFRTVLDRPEIGSALTRMTYARPSRGETSAAVHTRPSIEKPRWEVWRERDFAVRDEEIILRGTIDRLVILYDEHRPVAADILDFKTDAVSLDDPETLEARVETYRPQLQAYRRAVTKLLELEPQQISARLLFLVPGVVRII